MSDIKRKSGVIGWPVAHSRSPLIHNFWLEDLGIEGSYDLLPLEPERADEFFKTFADSGLVGANVTLPHKEAAFRCITETDEVARRLGSVNTIYLEDGIVRATSTDGYGFIAHLKSRVPSWDTTNSSAVVLGAGGSARAIIGALLGAGTKQVVVTNRTKERAEGLADTFGSAVSVADWEARGDILADANLLVNTTSLGMSGKPPLDISLAKLPAQSIVYDIIYVPLETNLLKNAASLGHHCVDGLGMLLHQAVPGFELWFGKRPTVTDALYHLVANSLKEENP